MSGGIGRMENRRGSAGECARHARDRGGHVAVDEVMMVEGH